MDKARLSGQEIRFLRSEMGHTPTQLAEAMACQEEVVERWEQDKAMTADEHVRFCKLVRQSLGDQKIDSWFNADDRQSDHHDDHCPVHIRLSKDCIDTTIANSVAHAA
jgi:hypothetical protein